MKSILILLLIFGFGLPFKSSIMAKTVSHSEDHPVQTTQSPSQPAPTTAPDPQPTSAPVSPQPTSPPPAPTDVPVTSAPQPTAVPPTAVPVQPTTVPIIQPTAAPTVVPVVNNTNSDPPSSQSQQTASQNIGGAPILTNQTSQTAEKLQSPPASDNYHAYNTVHTVPTPTPNVPVATALEQNAVTKPVAPLVRNLVNATGKIVDIPASLLFKQKPQQQYYKDSRISTDTSVTLLATAAILFFFGFVLANQRFSELFISKAKLVRSYLF
jgi:hypothetical protein